MNIVVFPVIEIFASIDGEGSRAGRLAQFVRLAGCNLSCSYCDTRYAWDSRSETVAITPMTAAEIVASLRPDITGITLTGGEPLAVPHVSELIAALVGAGYQLNIETNGAVDIAPFRHAIQGKSFFTIDYKLPSSGMQHRMLDHNYFALHPTDVVKFVVGSDADIAPMLALVGRMQQHYTTMPQIYIGTVWGQYNAQRLVELMLHTPLLANAVLQLQLHKFIWHPDTKGV